MNLPHLLKQRDDARLRSAVRVSRMDPKKLSADKPHGTRIKYMGGCKCVPCRAANSTYEVERAKARKNGDWNGLVSATAARNHIHILSEAGIGRRAISEAADVSMTMLSMVKAGRRLNIRKRTETAILAITVDAASDGAYIDAAPTWKQINELLTEGFTKKALAERLGLGHTIQLGKQKITAANAAKVDRLYRTLMAE